MRSRQTIALLAVIGLFISLYLSLYKVGLIGTLQCGTGSCELVQTSRWAVILGIPVAFYGVAGYAMLLGVALVGLQPRFLTRRGPAVLLAVLSTIGWVFTLYLTYVELFEIHAICRWCVGSAVIITAIWITALLGWRRQAISL